MDQRIVFFDIDKTLIDRELLGAVPESAVRSIKKLRENGHLAYINTGRVYGNIPPYIIDIGFDGYVCGCGTHVVADGITLLHHTVAHPRSCEIAARMRACRLEGVYEEKDNSFFETTVPETKYTRIFKEAFRRFHKDTTKTVCDFDFTFDKIFGWHDGSGNIEDMLTFVAGELSYTDRGDNTFELVPHGFTKATGMEVVLNHLGIPLSSSYAFGDSPNDLPMLEYTPNSIAMGGSTALYEIVSFVTKSVREDGIEYALRHFGLI